jgi:hypothetical protein
VSPTGVFDMGKNKYVNRSTAKATAAMLTSKIAATEAAEVMKTLEPKPKYKRYWVDSHCSGSFTLPADAPVRKGYDEKKTLCTIADCEIWDEIEFFYNGQWQEIFLRDPPTKHTISLTATITVTGNDSIEKIRAELIRKYGHDAGIEVLRSECLGNLDRD